jgi:hypothetical protein
VPRCVGNMRTSLDKLEKGGWGSIYLFWFEGSVARFCEHGNETSSSTKGGSFFGKLWVLSATQGKLCSLLLVDCDLSGSIDGFCHMELTRTVSFSNAAPYLC